MSEKRKVKNSDDNSNQTEENVQSPQGEGLNQDPLPRYEIRQNTFSAVETYLSDDFLQRSKQEGIGLDPDKRHLTLKEIRASLFQSDETLKHSDDDSCHVQEDALNTMVLSSEKERIARGLPGSSLPINKSKKRKFRSKKSNVYKRSFHIHDSDSDVESRHSSYGMSDTSLYFDELPGYPTELSVTPKPHFIARKIRLNVSETLENTAQSERITKIESKINMFLLSEEFSRHYHLYYSSYIDFVLPKLFPIFVIKFLQSACFPRFVSSFLHFYESFVDGFSIASDRYPDSSKKETFDENGQNTCYILRMFESAYERQDWHAFNVVYRSFLDTQKTTIFKLRGVMQETIFHFVKENIEQNVKKAYFGFCLKRKQTVLVVLIDNVFFDQKKTSTYRGLPILYKQWTETTEESVNTRKYEGRKEEPEFKEDVRLKIREYLMENSAKLMKSHSNIEIICASPYRSIENGYNIRKENCILIYCTMKHVIPLGEMCYEESYGGFKIDVREGFFYPYPRIGQESMDTFIAPTDRHPELKIGAEISRKDGTVKGTLGGFVRMGDHGEIGFITCAHVLHDEPERMIKKHAKIVQPSYGLLETNDVCGFLIKSVHPKSSDKTTVDASLVQVESSRKPTRISFTGLRKDQLRQLGFSPSEIYDGEILENAAINARCYKSGASTNFTIGKLEERSLSAKYIVDFRDPSQDAVFYDQYVVSNTSILPFASSGDSGAFVFQCLENGGKKSFACIGMIVGGTSDSKVVVTPIREVLNALDLQDTKKLCTFEDEKMETDETSMCYLS